MGKKKEHFNPAFENLRSMIKKVKKNQEGKSLPGPLSEEDKSLPYSPSEKEKPLKITGTEDVTVSEDDVFQSAMEGVIPLAEKSEKSVPIPSKDLRPPHPAPDDSIEGLMHLRRLVQGGLEMDISFTDEYIEGAVPGLSPKIMRTLKRGKFPVRGHLDLHGLTMQDAEVRVREFLIQSQKQGLRCVLIVHGRGLNSPDSIPVLKERIPVWLNRGPARKIVLAFATARPYDGGTGAIYVLLRNR